MRLASELNCKEEKPADDKVKPHICSSYPENVGPSDQPHNLRKDADSQIVLEMKVNDDVIAYAVKLKSKKEDPKVETNFFDRHGQIVARERNGRILKVAFWHMFLASSLLSLSQIAFRDLQYSLD